MPLLIDFQGRQLSLKPDSATRIGRALDNDLVITDMTVSQHHAVLALNDGGAFLRDLDSYNGTFIKGKRVKGGRLTTGSEVKFGQVTFVYQDNARAHSAAPLPSRAAAVWKKVSIPSPLRNPISGGAVAGAATALVVLTLVVTHLSRRGSSVSTTSEVGANLVTGQDYSLPNASSDFVGDWCGWERLASCDPDGACDQEPTPISLSFRNEGGSTTEGVVLHYQILGSADADVRDIHVDASDSRHVEVSFTTRNVDRNGVVHLGDDHEELVSLGPTAVRETDRYGDSVDGTVSKTQESVAQLQKCSEDFERTQEEYIKQHALEARGEVRGSVPR